MYWSKFPFKSTILENAHIDFHKQSLVMLKLYIEDSSAVFQLDGSPLCTQSLFVKF
jgi:hypothetical protein